MTTKTHSNAGTASNGNAVVNMRGIQTLKKTLKDGTLAKYYRHRATGTQLTGEPGSVEFETLRQQLDARVGKERIERATFRGLWDAWKVSPEYDEAATSQSHRKNNERIFAQVMAARVTNDNGTLLEPLGDQPVEVMLTDGFYNAIMKYRDNLKKARVALGKGLREVDAQMTAICALLAWAVKRRKLAHHPIGKYEKLYRSERCNVIFHMDQVQLWLQEARKNDAAHKGPDMERVFLLALTLGQRAGDLRQLRWSDYVIDRVTGARGFAIWPLKTRKTNRKIFVPVLPWVGDILDSMRGEPDEHILTLRGKPWASRTLSYYFGNVTRDAGLFATIERKDQKGNRVLKQIELHMHDLRGTAITLLAVAGNSERQIGSITGHSAKYISDILDQYVAADTRIAVSAIANLAKLPEMQQLEQQLSHLQPATVLQITHQPELPEQLIELEAAE